MSYIEINEIHTVDSDGLGTIRRRIERYVDDNITIRGSIGEEEAVVACNGATCSAAPAPFGRGKGEFSGQTIS